MTLPRCAHSQALTLGVQLELQIVATQTFDLAPAPSVVQIQCRFRSSAELALIGQERD